MDELLNRLGDSRGWEVDGRFVTVNVVGGRTQTVRCEEVDEGDGLMVRVSTEIGDAQQLDADRLRAALGLNWRLRHGSLAIHSQMLKMTHFLTAKRLPDELLVEVVEYLAHTADTYEKHLFGVDVS